MYFFVGGGSFWNVAKEDVNVEVVVINLSGVNILLLGFFNVFEKEGRSFFRLAVEVFSVAHVVTLVVTVGFLGKRRGQFRRIYEEPTPAISGFTFPVVCNAKGGERLGEFWKEVRGALNVAQELIRRSSSGSVVYV